MARKKRTNKKAITLEQLKSYIHGAIEFNDDDWHPTKEQWDKIVDMIMNLKEPEPKNVYVQPERTNQNGNGQRSLMDETRERMENPVTNEQGPRAPRIDLRKKYESTMNTTPANTEIVPDNLDEHLVPSDVQKVTSSGKIYRTPHLDTSKSDYDSGFE